MAQTLLIGIDVGTTATKAVLIDAAGQRRDGFLHAHGTARPQAGHAEQAPQDWMDGVLGALAHFASHHDLAGLLAIGFTSQVNTHVFVDAAGAPLLPALTWQDTRTAPDAASLEAQVTAEQKIGWFGAPMPIDASHALSRMAHVARCYPALWARTAHVLLPKDYCTLQLTGAVAADPIAAVGLVNEAGYVAELMALVPGALERLPPLVEVTAIVGRVRPGLPCAGVPVVVGTMDAWAGMFGVGAVANGDAMYQSGTSEIPGIVSVTLNPTPGVIVFPPYRGITMHAAPTQSGGAALAWVAQLLGRSPAEAVALAATVAPGVDLPIFLPHLSGERAPIWDSASRGVFARLGGSHGAPELAHAALEGVALSVRWAFEALQASSGLVPAVINLGGGGAQSDFWCQLRANVLGRPLQRAATPETAALGAAILAASAVGLEDDLVAVTRRLVRFDRSFAPDPALFDHYGERLAHYQALYQDLRPFNARF